jgi:uncharacterized protein YcbK (DUF882 family)
MFSRRTPPASKPGTASDGSPSTGINRGRRRLLAGAATLTAAPMLAVSRRVRADSAPRAIAFEHTHTGERLAVTYAYGDTYVPQALSAVKRLLRDFRDGQTHDIDPALLDQLHLLATITGTRSSFQVISGYRSPATNRMLQKGGHGVASHSLHLEGRAIDIRLSDVPLTDLRDAALTLAAGGVGYYPTSAFVHVDTGRVRRW